MGGEEVQTGSINRILKIFVLMGNIKIEQQVKGNVVHRRVVY